MFPYDRKPRERAIGWPDRWLQLCGAMALALVFGGFALILWDLIRLGTPSLSWSFFVESPHSGGRSGGIGSILVSTLLILGVALATVVPLGLAAAMALAEWLPPASRFARLSRMSLDMLAGMPSIVFGLFGNAFFAVYLGLGLSILTGGLTLACMILPLFVSAAEASLRSVPDAWRAGGDALGMRRTWILFRLSLPVALPGIAAGLVLAIGRALAETAALIFTSGYADRMPESLHDSGRALSVHIYDLAMNVAGGDPNAYGSAMVLVVLLVVINVVAMKTIHHGLYRRLIQL